jgi:hypothetical protein
MMTGNTRMGSGAWCIHRTRYRSYLDIMLDRDEFFCLRIENALNHGKKII